MAIRTLTITLLTLLLGASACALEPLDPAQDDIGDQSTSLTTEDGTVVADPVVRPVTIAGESREGVTLDEHGAWVQAGAEPSKPQPDPWNPPGPDTEDDPSQPGTLPCTASGTTSSSAE